jgi:phosphoribosyl 1,2-cyclic phosphodiesterase
MTAATNEGEMIDFEVVATGSKGNAVVLNGNILIDCGVSWKALKSVYSKLQLVLLTHRHGDHFNKTTIRKLALERPMLRWGCCEWLVKDLINCGVSKSKIDIYDFDTGLWYGEKFPVGIEAFPLDHDVPNCGYKIKLDNHKVFYATDTNSLQHITAKDYDLYLVEANYAEEEITERIRKKIESGEYAHEWEVLKNHLSREKAEDWLYKNMGQHSHYVLLHQHED